MSPALSLVTSVTGTVMTTGVVTLAPDKQAADTFKQARQKTGTCSGGRHSRCDRCMAVVPGVRFR